jgi:hypothetical protein
MRRGFLSVVGSSLTSVRNRDTHPLHLHPHPRSLRGGTFGIGSGAEAQMRAMGSNGMLFAIVDRIITAYSQVEWHLYRSAASGHPEDRTEVTSHAAVDLWAQPNKFMTGPAFRETAQQHEELVGEQYWVAAKDERFNIPLELWPVRPDRMEPRPRPADVPRRVRLHAARAASDHPARAGRGVLPAAPQPARPVPRVGRGADDPH